MMEQAAKHQSTSNFLQSSRVIFGITFGQTTRSKKTIFILIVTFLPVLLAIYYRLSGRSAWVAPGQVMSIVMPFFLQFLSVLIALFYATALVADEIDNRTITYLFTRPVRKYSIILGKFAAYMLEVLIILVPPMVLTFFIIAMGNGMLSKPELGLSLFVKRLGVTVLALMVYGAIFTFFGAWWKRPVVIGLLFAFGWEKIVLIAPGAVRRFSVIHYLMSIFPGGRQMQRLPMILPKELMISDSSFLLSIIVIFTVACVFLGLAIFIIHRKEYRFE